MPDLPETTGINTYSESTLHAQVKHWYAQPGDRLEVSVQGHIIDVVREDLLIEIQTGNFSHIKKKLHTLLPDYRLHVVYPLPERRWIIKMSGDGTHQLSRRRSPKRGHILQSFAQLLYIADFLLHPNFSLEVLMIEDEEIRRDDGKGSWRRRGVSITDRRLVEVRDSIVFRSTLDYVTVLPESLPSEFTTNDLAAASSQSKAVAGKVAYTLKKIGAIQMIGKRGNAFVYGVNQD